MNAIATEVKKKEVTAKSFTLRTENGAWLGQIVLTSDGMFASVTDYGNLSFAWRSFGDDFIRFMCDVGVDYFATKMANGISYIAYSKKIDKACDIFAKNILPALQKVLKEEYANRSINQP